MAMIEIHNRYGRSQGLPNWSNTPWAGARQPLDPGLRRAIHGPIQSMDEDREESFWHWLFHRG